MNDLEVIARDLRLSVDVLKRPVELLKQGYEPAFLGTYRPDELGQLETTALARLKRALDYRDRIAAFRIKVKSVGQAEGWWQDSLQPLLDEAASIAEIDGLTRNLRSRKSSRVLAEKDPRLAQLGQAILTMTGSAPSSIEQWVAEQAGIATEDAGKLLNDTKHWLQTLLSEDAELIHRLGRQILKRCQVSVSMLADQPEKSPDGTEAKSNDSDANAEKSVEAESQADLPGAGAGQPPENIHAEEDSLAASYSGAEDHAEVQEIEDRLNQSVDSDSSQIETSQAPVSTEDAQVEAPSTSGSNVVDTSPQEGDKLLSNFGKGRGSSGKVIDKKVKSVTLRQLSPRQRRRRWLRSILQRYAKLKKPLNRLSHYQVLMLGRGQRSQIISVKLDYDRQAMTKIAREAFCPGNHPLHALLVEIADEALKKSILPKLEQDVFLEIEEAAHQELIEMAVSHLQAMLLQRPVRGHRILVIDAMGPKTAAVAVVGPQGQVEFTGDLSAVSSRPDIVSQNLATLGQWIHQHKVTLVAISNGNTRRYLIHTVHELMKQSSEVGLRWTIVDRTGADAYCDTQQSLRELPKIAKRHRAAVWLGWKLQDPLIELTKVDPARLRLGSYQRELPQDVLEDALLNAVSESVAARGIDVWNSHEKSLVCLPGVDALLAKAIVQMRDAGEITNREELVARLHAKTPENHLRQAIGYLRIFGSDQSLDGTMIHPDDYRLAERLIATGQVVSPAPSPENWSKPSTAVSRKPEKTSDEATEQSESTIPVDSMEPAASPDQQAVAEEAAPPDPSEQTNPTDDATPTELNESSESSQASITEAVESEQTDETGANSTSEIRPENPTGPTLPPPLAIDVEKLARSWQVGREKMRMVARCLQQPFADSRDARMPIPLLTQVPTLECLIPGMTAWGIVVGVADFGAFVDLGPNCSGLIHVSRLSREFVDDPQEVVQMGELLQVWVVSVDAEKNRVALSALPPGVEQVRRPNFHEGESDSQSNRHAGRSGNFQNQSGERSRFQGRNQGQRRDGQSGPGSQVQSGGASRTGQSRDGQGRPPFGQKQGPGGRGGGKHDRNRAPRGEDRSDRRNENSTQSEQKSNRQPKPPKPAPPITEGMQQGTEPMRSFSDLLQFYQVKRDETPPPKVESAAPPTESLPAADKNSSSVAPARPDIAEDSSSSSPDAESKA
jgi:transcriptional accessory protein Tex/SPT6